MAVYKQTLKLSRLSGSLSAAYYNQKVKKSQLFRTVSFTHILNIWNLTHEMIAVYVWQVIEHAENPRNVGKLDPMKSSVGTGLVGAPACGDVMKLQIEVNGYGKIVDAKFKELS